MDSISERTHNLWSWSNFSIAYLKHHDIRINMRGTIFFVTFSLMAVTVLTASVLKTYIRVQPGPVKVKQGNNVSLWCELTEYSQNRLTVFWQSPPNFRTRTANCETLGVFQRKYVMSCAEDNINLWWYNMTITDVRWVDRGIYRCIYYRYKGIVDVQVRVPVREMSLTYVSNSTTKPLFLSKGVDAFLTCTTDCAYPAPKISWFENDQPFKGSATVSNTEAGCTGDKEGQIRTKSTVTVTGKSVEKARKESKISCTAEDDIGKLKISRMIDIYYDVLDAVTDQRVPASPLKQSEVILVLCAGVGLAIILLGCACLFRWLAQRDKKEEVMNMKKPHD